MSKHIYSKIVIVSIIILFVLTSLSPAQKVFEQEADVSSNDFEIKHTITFSEKDLIFGTMMGYDTVQIKDGAFINDVGKPMIPIKNIQIALPNEMQATNIKFVNIEQIMLPGEYNIAPVQPLQHTDVSKNMVEFAYPDYSYFQSFVNYPNKNIELVGQSDLAGQPIVEITIYPVHYISAKKQISLITSIEFIIEGIYGYVCGDYLPISSSEQAIESYENMITDMVENPEDVVLMSSQDPQPIGVGSGDYDYVVITTTTFDNYFEPLVEWKTQKGIPANIVTTTWIYNSGGYSGTNQQKIRAFVQDAHSTWGTTYFLLGGDTSYVPCYTKYIPVGPSDGRNIPTDTYYADYDDDWICEVHVGRASVYTTGSSAGGVTNFVNKILTYEKDPPLTNYAKKASLFGFDLDSITDGEDAKIDIDNYYIPSDWDMTNVYDSHGGSHETNVKNAVNDGQNLINHIDHCGEYYIGTGHTNHGTGLSTGEVDAFYNGDYQSVFYSLGCWPAAFDYSNCIAEHFVRDTNGGGVAFVGNTRYGWYQQGSDDGASTRYDRYFFRSLFSQNHYKIGNCFSDHKRDAYISMYQDDYNKYIFTELSLLGDPEMPIWKENPMTISANYPTEISLGVQQFTVNSDVPYAFICLWKDDEVYEVATANSAGDYTFSINPTTEGTMHVTLTEQDYLPYEGSATVSGSPDTDPPTPNPMTWNIPPVASSPNDIVMQATTASDDTPPIYYYFDFVSGGSGGTDSSWQTNTLYIDSGLQPNTAYTYRVKARDSFDPPNEGSYSTSESVYTHANTPNAPTVNNPTQTSLDVNVNPGDNPTYTDFAIICDSTSPSDPTWEDKYVNSVGNPSSTEIWQTDSAWGTITVNDLNEETEYCFKVKARNEDLIETDFGPPGCGNTEILSFIITGDLTYQDMSPVYDAVITITNLDTMVTWIPDLVDNHYSLELTPGVDISALDVVRTQAKDDIEWINVTDHTIQQSDIDSGGYNEDLILNEFYLDLIDFPMYEAETPYDEMAGPAVAQMTLNYIWWNATENPDGPPLLFDDQSWLYDRGIENNSNPGLDYLDTNGMWNIIQYNKPLPYNDYGYNFLKKHDADQDVLLKQICQWINYTIGTYGGYKEGHPLHVPSVVPMFGDYSSWMAIRGIHTDQYAYPMPDELTVYGFWVNDPIPTGIGENSYKTGPEFTTTYYETISVAGDPYEGEYVAICEPPETVENCNIQLANSKPRFNIPQKDFIIYTRDIDIISEQIQTITNKWIIQAAIDGVSEQLIPYDENFAALFEKTSPGIPIFVRSENGNDYYAVPFNILPRSDPDDHKNTVIVILIDADDGSFKEASWTKESVKYLPISKSDVREMLPKIFEEMGIELVDLNSVIIDLVHRDSTPYYPDWRVTIKELEIEFFIGQDGTIS